MYQAKKIEIRELVKKDIKNMYIDELVELKELLKTC